MKSKEIQLLNPNIKDIQELHHIPRAEPGGSRSIPQTRNQKSVRGQLKIPTEKQTQGISSKAEIPVEVVSLLPNPIL